jgi:hypothetical protein
VIGRELPARTPEEVARLVRALGGHRYVAGRLILVHAFVFASLETTSDDLAAAIAWAKELLGASDVDPASRDERLWRRATEKELAGALAILWNDDDAGRHSRASLASRLGAIGAIDDAMADAEAALFDESREDEVFPVLVDAGWELLPLAALDPERHKGAIESFGERFAFDCAKFDEESAIDAPPPLHELPLLGPAELLHAAEHAILKEPLVLWTEGNATYHDYVLRGVLRAAKLD